MIPPDEHLSRPVRGEPWRTDPAPRSQPPSWLAAAFGFVLLACSAALVVAATIATVRWIL